jgi:hypothetical protein
MVTKIGFSLFITVAWLMCCIILLAHAFIRKKKEETPPNMGVSHKWGCNYKQTGELENEQKSY